MPFELLGTRECHLCEIAYDILQDVLKDYPHFETLIQTDIADHPALLERFGTQIPVLGYQQRYLCWPFGREEVLDHLSLNALENPLMHEETRR